MRIHIDKVIVASRGDAKSELESSSVLQDALMQALGKPSKPMVHVDIAAKLRDAGLEEHLPLSVWPQTNAVRNLATWTKSAKKYHGENAYVFIDLKRYHRGRLILICIISFL